MGAAAAAPASIFMILSNTLSLKGKADICHTPTRRRWRVRTHTCQHEGSRPDTRQLLLQGLGAPGEPGGPRRGPLRPGARAGTARTGPPAATAPAGNEPSKPPGNKRKINSLFRHQKGRNLNLPHRYSEQWQQTERGNAKEGSRTNQSGDYKELCAPSAAAGAWCRCGPSGSRVQTPQREDPRRQSVPFYLSKATFHHPSKLFLVSAF